MEKISCNVVSDLLPLYCDQVCTQDSRRLVEAHLRECAQCRGLYGKMQGGFQAGEYQKEDPDKRQERNKEEIREKGREQQEEKIIKDMAAVWKKSVFKSFMKGLAVASGVLLILFAAWMLTNWPFVRIPPDDVTASAVVDNSRFTIRLDTSNRYKVPSVDLTTTEDGILYIILKHGIVPVKSGADTDYGGIYSGSMIVETEAGNTVRIREIYYGTKDDRKLLWKES